MMVASSLAGTMLAEAMRYVPGNEQYRDRVEFAALAHFFFGRAGYWTVQLFLNLSLLSINLVSILVSAQVMDLILIRLFGATGALEFYPHPGWAWSHSDAAVSPFGSAYVISLGLLMVVVLVIPMGYLNLDDNMIVQLGTRSFRRQPHTGTVSLVLTLVIMSVWFVDFGLRFAEGHVQVLPLIGPDQTQVLGTVIFNYAGAMTIPSWVNERVRPPADDPLECDLTQ